MKKIDILSILSSINYVDFIGDRNAIITDVIKLNGNNVLETALMWCSDKFLDIIPNVNCGTIIISKKASFEPKSKCNYILVENPRKTFGEIMTAFFEPKRKAVISKSSTIDRNVKLGLNVFIGENVVIEEGCVIGNNVVIMHNSVIMRDSIIGNNVFIGANCSIGGIGFGYEKDDFGQFQLISHIGNVILADFVEIGNNTCIDRAVLGSTIIGKNVKIDNLVHIAHGVCIGENSVIIANSMIAGSVTIGNDVWIAPSVSVLNQKEIRDGAFVGIGAVVLKNIEEQRKVVGNPGRIIG